jgi:hypothetical protein
MSEKLESHVPQKEKLLMTSISDAIKLLFSIKRVEKMFLTEVAQSIRDSSLKGQFHSEGNRY